MSSTVGFYLGVVGAGLMGMLLGALIGWLVYGLVRLLKTRNFEQAFARPTTGLAAVGLTAALAAGVGIATTGFVGGALGAAGSGTPAPPWSPGDRDPLDAADQQDFIDYGDSLVFSDCDDDAHGAGDMQFLDVDLGAGPEPGGPLSLVCPQKDSHKNVHNKLADGRIVGKVWIDPEFQDTTGTAGYAKLGLPPGWSYVWMDGDASPTGTPPQSTPAQNCPGKSCVPRKGLRGNPDRDEYRAVFIPVDTNFPPVGPRSVNLFTNGGKPPLWSRALARWSFWEDDNHMWLTCTKYGCCDVE